MGWWSFLIGTIVAGPVWVLGTWWAARRLWKSARRLTARARGHEHLVELGQLTGGLAHEIKNPLSTVGLNAQLLVEGLNDAELPEHERGRLLNRLDSLSREVERLRGILTDFLQFAGRVKLDIQPRDLGRIVADLYDFFHPQCDQNGVVMRTKLPDVPVKTPVDEGLLKQALLNLMINATQAMADGAPDSGSDAHDARGELILRIDADDDEARIHVIDTGPGIEPDRIQQIFHPYVSHTRGGTGLGLSTARRIIEEHGGRIVVHSEVGRGSDFVVHLPRRHEGTK